MSLTELIVAASILLATLAGTSASIAQMSQAEHKLILKRRDYQQLRNMKASLTRGCKLEAAGPFFLLSSCETKSGAQAITWSLQ